METTKKEVAPPSFMRPSKWTLLLTSDNHGLVGEFGHTWEGSPTHYERVNVYAVEPGAVPDVGGVTDAQIEAKFAAAYYPPKEPGNELLQRVYPSDLVKVARSLLATKAAAQAAPQQAVPEGASDQAHVLPPVAAPVIQHGADIALLTEMRRWAGDDTGYASKMIRSAADEIDRLAEVLASGCRKARHACNKPASDLAHVARQPAAQAERAAVPEDGLTTLTRGDGTPSGVFIRKRAAPSPAATQEGEQGSEQTTVDCPACNGKGMVGGCTGQTPENYEEITMGCDECDGQGKIIVSRADLAQDRQDSAQAALDEVLGLLEQSAAALEAMLNKRGYGCGEGSDHQVEMHNERANKKAVTAVAAIHALRTTSTPADDSQKGGAA